MECLEKLQYQFPSAEFVKGPAAIKRPGQKIEVLEIDEDCSFCLVCVAKTTVKNHHRHRQSSTHKSKLAEKPAVSVGAFVYFDGDKKPMLKRQSKPSADDPTATNASPNADASRNASPNAAVLTAAAALAAAAPAGTATSPAGTATSPAGTAAASTPRRVASPPAARAPRRTLFPSAPGGAKRGRLREGKQATLAALGKHAEMVQSLAGALMQQEEESEKQTEQKRVRSTSRDSAFKYGVVFQRGGDCPQCAVRSVFNTGKYTPLRRQGPRSDITINVFTAGGVIEAAATRYVCPVCGNRPTVPGVCTTEPGGSAVVFALRNLSANEPDKLIFKAHDPRIMFFDQSFLDVLCRGFLRGKPLTDIASSLTDCVRNYVYTRKLDEFYAKPDFTLPDGDIVREIGLRLIGTVDQKEGWVCHLLDPACSGHCVYMKEVDGKPVWSWKDRRGFTEVPFPREESFQHMGLDSTYKVTKNLRVDGNVPISCMCVTVTTGTGYIADVLLHGKPENGPSCAFALDAAAKNMFPLREHVVTVAVDNPVQMKRIIEEFETRLGRVDIFCVGDQFHLVQLLLQGIPQRHPRRAEFIAAVKHIVNLIVGKAPSHHPIRTKDQIDNLLQNLIDDFSGGHGGVVLPDQVTASQAQFAAQDPTPSQVEEFAKKRGMPRRPAFLNGGHLRNFRKKWLSKEQKYWDFFINHAGENPGTSHNESFHALLKRQLPLKGSSLLVFLMRTSIARRRTNYKRLSQELQRAGIIPPRATDEEFDNLFLDLSLKNLSLRRPIAVQAALNTERATLGLDSEFCKVRNIKKKTTVWTEAARTELRVAVEQFIENGAEQRGSLEQYLATKDHLTADFQVTEMMSELSLWVKNTFGRDFVDQNTMAFVKAATGRVPLPPRAPVAENDDADFDDGGADYEDDADFDDDDADYEDDADFDDDDADYEDDGDFDDDSADYEDDGDFDEDDSDFDDGDADFDNAGPDYDNDSHGAVVDPEQADGEAEGKASGPDTPGHVWMHLLPSSDAPHQ